VVVAAVAAGAAVVASRGGDDEAPATGTGSKLEALPVAGADVRATWNGAVGDLGDELPEPRWELDDALGLQTSSLDFDDWGLGELYRHPFDDLAAIPLVGRYGTEAVRARFRADAIAAVAVGLGVAEPTATDLVDNGLGWADPTGPPSKSFDRGNATVVLERGAGTDQLRVTAAPG
jgi:hypothetical protein